MLLCAHYILPITSEPIQRGAVLVRDGRIYDVGPVDILKAHYPEEEVKDFGMAALMPGLIDLHTPTPPGCAPSPRRAPGWT